jgi:hypothetical protein
MKAIKGKEIGFTLIELLVVITYNRHLGSDSVSSVCEGEGEGKDCKLSKQLEANRFSCARVYD